MTNVVIAILSTQRGSHLHSCPIHVQISGRSNTLFISGHLMQATMDMKLHSHSDCVPIGRRVRQGDTISSQLFITLLEHAFKMLYWDSKGIAVDSQ